MRPRTHAKPILHNTELPAPKVPFYITSTSSNHRVLTTQKPVTISSSCRMASDAKHRSPESPPRTVLWTRMLSRRFVAIFCISCSLKSALCRSKKVRPRDAAERVSDAVVIVGLAVHSVTCSPRRETLGWEFDPVRPVVEVSRRGLWRLRIALFHVAFFGLGKRGRGQFFG